MDALQTFLASEAGIAVKGALVAAFLDLAVGVYAAVKDGTFAWDAIAAYLRKHILGRVAPLATLIAGAYLSGDGMLTAFAVAGLTTYAAETIASIKNSLMPPAPSDVPQVDTPAANVNPVPTD